MQIYTPNTYIQYKSIPLTHIYNRNIYPNTYIQHKYIPLTHIYKQIYTFNTYIQHKYIPLTYIYTTEIDNPNTHIYITNIYP